MISRVYLTVHHFKHNYSYKCSTVFGVIANCSVIMNYGFKNSYVENTYIGYTCFIVQEHIARISALFLLALLCVNQKVL